MTNLESLAVFRFRTHDVAIETLPTKGVYYDCSVFSRLSHFILHSVLVAPTAHPTSMGYKLSETDC